MEGNGEGSAWSVPTLRFRFPLRTLVFSVSPIGGRVLRSLLPDRRHSRFWWPPSRGPLQCCRSGRRPKCLWWSSISRRSSPWAGSSGVGFSPRRSNPLRVSRTGGRGTLPARRFSRPGALHPWAWIDASVSKDPPGWRCTTLSSRRRFPDVGEAPTPVGYPASGGHCLDRHFREVRADIGLFFRERDVGIAGAL